VTVEAPASDEQAIPKPKRTRAKASATAGGSDLVVVESPTKARTLERMLGPGYTVRASFGHVADLPKSKLGVDEDSFVPQYEVPEDSKKTVAELKREAGKADRVWLASDLDREGEAIAWHVARLIEVPKQKLRRVTFHEITAPAIADAFKHPRDIDEKLVNAQQARRVVDRLVGYKLSPLLWKLITYGLSAGRVQSVALRLIVDREREIRAFVPQEYWSLDAVLANAAGVEFAAEVIQHKGKKLAIESAAQAAKHRAAIESAALAVGSIEKRESSRNAAAPFTTSTLQQDASRKLGYSLRRTMVLAQQLYEGIAVGAEGTVGLITYMRTDSLHIAEGALKQARGVIASEFGDRYALEKPRHFKTRSKGAQEAHEAIRPTDLARTPQRMAKYLTKDQHRLYTLIWQRTLASQMPPARYEGTRVDVNAGEYVLRANGRKLLFDGFLRVYTEATDEPEQEVQALPELAEGDRVALRSLAEHQHFTQPPGRFTEASLVKALEEYGIGRPSTYAPTISTLTAKYVTRDGRALVPTDMGMAVADFLKNHFPSIVDTSFTARMEEDLDKIADGGAEWAPIVRDFYGPFAALLAEKSKTVKKSDVTEEKTDQTCPKCSRPLIIKLGKFGRFYSCTGFVKGKKGAPLAAGACDYAAPLEGEAQPVEILADEQCPECGKPLAKRVGRYGPFVGCTGYPACSYIKKNIEKTDLTCPTCGQGVLVKRRGRFRAFFYGCERYPDCKHTQRTLDAAPPEKEKEAVAS